LLSFNDISDEDNSRTPASTYMCAAGVG